MNRGVNLGNWLALEKWMSPELFDGTSAEDESHLVTELDDVARRERFKVHRDSWITDRDFAYLAGRGIDFVRLPVPYFVFGDYDPFIGCIDYVDKAFRWGERYKIKILVDLHTVPDSQNGFDNGGICGVCKFHKSRENVEVALEVLGQLAARYRDNEYLWGIEVLNEPVSPELWELLDVPNRYPAVDKAYAEGSEGVPTEFLKEYYKETYKTIRAEAEDIRIVFHDGFRAEWFEFFTEPDFENFVVDTHRYVMKHSVGGVDRDLDDYVAFVQGELGGDVREMSRHFPVLVGEWNLDTKSKRAASLVGEERLDYYRKLAAAHFGAWEPAVAWSYWSYKLPVDAPEFDVWDLLKTIELGYFPNDLSDPSAEFMTPAAQAMA